MNSKITFSFYIIVFSFLAPFLSSISNAKECQSVPKSFTNFKETVNSSSLPTNTFSTVTGKNISLQNFNGSGLIVNFWATWCAPCVREMPQLNLLAALVKVNKISVLTISEDRSHPSKLKSFFEKLNLYDLKVFLDKKGALLKSFALDGIPSTILIDRKGNQVGKVIGAAEWDSYEIVNFLRNCLGSKPKGAQ